MLAEDGRRFADLSEALKVASGDTVDMPRFEPAMRKLIDTYVRARDVDVISDFGKRGLTYGRARRRRGRSITRCGGGDGR